MKKNNTILYGLIIGCLYQKNISGSVINSLQEFAYRIAVTTAVYTLTAVSPLGLMGDFLTYLKIQDRWLFNIASYSRRPLKPLINVLVKGNREYTKKKQAHVFSSQLLHQQENEHLNERSKRVQRAQKKILGTDTPLKIAFCASGGGYRSTVATLGALCALDITGLLDLITYVSTLSGSTWAVASWLNSRLPIQEITSIVQGNLADNTGFTYFNLGVPEMMGVDSWNKFAGNMLTKWVYDQPVSIVDLYGAVITNDLLNPYKNRMYMRMSEQASLIESGTHPLPLYSVIGQTPNTPNTWFECSPYAIGSTYYDAFIDIWALGRTFKYGKSIIYDTAPEVPLSFLLGMFGSIFGIDASDLVSWILNTKDISIQDVVARQGFLAFKRALEKELNRGSLSMARINNFMFGINKSEIAQEPYLGFMDAGVDFNLPIPPLLDRNIDVILVCDASTSKFGRDGIMLLAAAEYAEKMGKPFPLIEAEYLYEHVGNNETMLVFPQDILQRTILPEGPIIIYLPLRNDLTNPFFGDFNVIECIHNDFCSTLNFAYSKDEFDMIACLAHYNIENHSKEIINIFHHCAQLKKLSEVF